MAALGEEIHCMVWPGWPSEKIDYNIQPIIDAATREYAFETQNFVVSACGYITKEMVPDTFHFKEKTCWDSVGGSSIVDPLGNYLAGPELRKEAILYADIDMSMRAIAKLIFDAVGHYTRWDVLTLNINDQPYEPLKPMRLHEPRRIEIDAEKLEKIAEKLGLTTEKVEALIKELELEAPK
jgi:amidase/nitrilase